ncbi:MAG: peptidoglycan-binding domain-containing protein [Candidatus Paceibacteria bacterium]
MFLAIFGLSAQTAKALTFDELVAQVASLKKELQTLKASLKASVTSSVPNSDPITLSFGSKGPLVEKLQNALKKKGFFNDKVTKYYGSVTTGAVKKYQLSVGLKATGIADADTQKLLFGEDTTTTSNKGEGSENKVASQLCLNRSANVVNPYPPTRSLNFVLGIKDPGTGFLYVKPNEKPALYPYNVNEDDPNSGVYPKAPYTVGSASTRLVFYKALLENDYPAGSFDLAANPSTGIDDLLGKIYYMSPDGSTITPISWDPGTVFPRCTGNAINAPVTPVPPTCIGCGTLGENGGGEGKYFGHWKRAANPVTIGVAYLADQGLYGNAAYDFAFTDWNASPVLNLIPGNQVKIVNGYYDQPFLASTSVLISNSDQHPHIVSAEIRLNDKYLAIGSGTPPEWRQHALCDAMGHAFGLLHQDENFLNTNKGSCMDYTIDPAGQAGGVLSNLHPNINDFTALSTAHHENPGDIYGNKPEGEKPNQTLIYNTPLPQ